MRQKSLRELWDLLLLAFALPFACALALVPGDLQQHHGKTRPGSATVVAVEHGYRGLIQVFVDVRDSAGTIVARHQEIAVDAPESVGSTIPVHYTQPVDGSTQVYPEAADPLGAHLIAGVTGAVLSLIALPFTVARLVRGIRWVATRLRSPRTGPYRARHGYSKAER